MTAQTPSILIDLLGILHLGAMAIGLGAAILGDVTLLRQGERRLTVSTAAQLEVAHRFALPALLAAWLSGLGLVLAIYGADPLLWPPILTLKIAAVAALTATAAASRIWLLPQIWDGIGRSLPQMPRGTLRRLAVFSGLALGGWLSALVLGASERLADTGSLTLGLLVLGFYALGIGLALRIVTQMAERAYRVYGITGGAA